MWTCAVYLNWHLSSWCLQHRALTWRAHALLFFGRQNARKHTSYMYIRSYTCIARPWQRRCRTFFFFYKHIFISFWTCCFVRLTPECDDDTARPSNYDKSIIYVTCRITIDVAVYSTDYKSEQCLITTPQRNITATKGGRRPGDLIRRVKNLKNTYTRET